MCAPQSFAATHLEQNSSVQCVVSHWSTIQEISLAQQHDPRHRSRFSSANAPIIEFHGSIDSTINISEANAVQAQYQITGVAYQMHVLEGCPHGSWCYNGKGVCKCTAPPTPGHPGCAFPGRRKPLHFSSGAH